MSDLRFRQGDVTEALVRATEKASEMEATDVVVILYSRKKEETGYKMRYVCSEDVTIETANWMIDKAKHFLMEENGRAD